MEIIVGINKIDIRKFLSNFRNKKVYFVSNPGNAGDAFIAYSTFYLFNELGIDYEVIQSESISLEG